MTRPEGAWPNLSSNQAIRTNLVYIVSLVYFIFVASKLKILAFQVRFFYALTSATLATSRGPNFSLSNLNRVSNFSKRPQLSYEILFVGLEWKWGGFRLCFPKWAAAAPPPCIWEAKKPMSFRVKGNKVVKRTATEYIVLMYVEPQKEIW